ncbi:MAG: 4-hydroxy-tetrahydrodipicolinate reductase [Candidatus Aphodosoma sp.]
MKIALIGYGKMGHIVERIALERGHEIVSKIDADNGSDFESKEFATADVAIEFTAPQVAAANYRRAWQAGVPVVSGTTGWTAVLPEIRKEIADGGYTLFWTSNFSLGVNILFAINRQLAKIMNDCPAYSAHLTEVHHTAKKDAPSGTAITLAEGLIENIDRIGSWALTDGDSGTAGGTLPVTAIRKGTVPGIHEVEYTSAVDRISIRHEAFSRDGFALGAVMAAEYVVSSGQKGLLGMDDMLCFDK